MKTKFVMLGGFLGAGKTTTIGRLAQMLVAHGKRVAVITNDQAAGLVDSQTLESFGLDVGEVAGACFCCSFDQLTDVAKSLGDGTSLDYILAEPVGSCTDLVATVVHPLRKFLHDTLEVLPYGVLFKPSHGQKILSGQGSGFSPQAAYIFHKQLEEADYFILNRIDTLDESLRLEIRQLIHQVDAGVRLFEVSAKTGEGFEALFEFLLTAESTNVGSRILEIDYDTYADGEAELGWLNSAAVAEFPDSVSISEMCYELVGRCQSALVAMPATIAHLKCSVQTLDAETEDQAVCNVIDNASAIEYSLNSEAKSGKVRIILNARVACPPESLEQVCQTELQSLIQTLDGNLRVEQVQAFRPGRPTPTHRFSNSVS